MAIKSKLTGLGMAAGLAQQVAGTVANSLTAAGNNQATALQMSLDDQQIFTTVAASTGAIFAPGTTSNPTPYSAGDEVAIANHGANSLSVYPATGGKIGTAAANAAFAIAVGKTGYFTSIDGLNWTANVSA